jgi:hypothetical protein
MTTFCCYGTTVHQEEAEEDLQDPQVHQVFPELQAHQVLDQEEHRVLPVHQELEELLGLQVEMLLQDHLVSTDPEVLQVLLDLQELEAQVALLVLLVLLALQELRAHLAHLALQD